MQRGVFLDEKLFFEIQRYIHFSFKDSEYDGKIILKIY